MVIGKTQTLKLRKGERKSNRKLARRRGSGIARDGGRENDGKGVREKGR